MAKSKTSTDTSEPAVPAAEPTPEPPPRRTEFYPQAHAPVAEPDAVPSAPPIDGLKVGRIVHVVTGGKTRAAIVAEVYDAGTGDIGVVVFEPVAPLRQQRLVFAGKGELAVEDKTWSWMFEGQATRYAPQV
jgi:hypothetical protein